VENQDPEVSLDLQMKAIFAARPKARQEFSALIKRWAVSKNHASGPHRKRSRVRRSVAA